MGWRKTVERGVIWGERGIFLYLERGVFAPARRGLVSAMSARSRGCSIAELGLRCDHGSFEEGHCLLPSRGPPPSYHCTGCDAQISPSEAARHVNAVQQLFVELQVLLQAGQLHSGCRAALDAEVRARSILAPQHHAWMPWVALVGTLAAKVASTSLLLVVYAKRQEMLGGEVDALRPDDVYLAIQYALAIGFGSPAATASLVSAFHIDQSLCGTGDELGEVAFIERWMPAGAMWSPHVRTAAGVALGLVVPPPALLVPSDLQPNPRMAALREGQPCDLKLATLAQAASCIADWEQRRAATVGACVGAAAATVSSNASSAAGPTAGLAHTDESTIITHEYSSSHPKLASPLELNRVRLIEQALDEPTCEKIMAAIEAASQARGWDKDRHGKCPPSP